MPGEVATPTLKLTWSLEDFSSSVAVLDDLDHCPTTGFFPVYPLGGTHWKIDLCPRTDDGAIALRFSRTPTSTHPEPGFVSFSYSVSILRNDGGLFASARGTWADVPPGTWTEVSIVRTTDLLTEQCLRDDQLNLTCEIRRVPGTVGVASETMWQDELLALSEDMSRLFKSGYASNIEIVADDGYRIKVHSFMLSARWPYVGDKLRERPDTNRIEIHGVSGPVLNQFVSYLYTGVIPDPTPELFDFAVAQDPTMREDFHTLFDDMSVRSQQDKDRLVVTWFVEESRGGGVDFWRVFDLGKREDSQLMVEISIEGTDDPKLSASFTVLGQEIVQLKCSSTLLVNDVRVTSYSSVQTLYHDVAWRFLDSVPESFLRGRPARRRVVFDLEIAYKSFETRLEHTVTEFYTTGRPGVKNTTRLSNELHAYFKERVEQQMCDVALRTEDSVYFSLKPVLMSRCPELQSVISSSGLTCDVILKVHGCTARTLGLVLEYITTGKIRMLTHQDTILVFCLACKFKLRGLVGKCHRFLGGVVCNR